jgi:PAS domain S-box-containing protein
MKEIIIVLDKTDKVVKVNREGSVFFNKTYGDIIGQPVTGLFESIGPSQDMGPLSIVKHSEKYEESEMYFPEKNMWCLVTVAPVLHDKTLMGAVCILTDITQLKKMQDSILEAKNDWEDTFDTINDAITIHDREFNVIRTNRAAETMLGLPLLQIMKQKCFTSYHGTDYPPEGCPSCDTLKTGDACSTEIFETRLGKYLEIKALPRYDKQNHVVGLIHVVRDITERKKAEEERKKLEAQLIHAQKMESIGRLAGGIAHDFNNLLSVIIGCSELGLMSLPEDSTLRDQLAMVKEAGDRATALTRQLLAFSRKQILEMKEVNLMDIVDHMGKMLSRLIGEQIAMETKNSGRVSNVKADKVQVEQIIMNLVVNARDSMPNGGRLIIETADILLEGAESHHSESVEPGRYVMLSVTDDGEGMTREVKEKIFEPFFTTKGKGYGTGLGLATVYGIVRQHKGHIAVDSEPGRGTTFKIYFPVSETAMEESLIERPGVTIQRGNETVLVVDDEAFICKMAADALQPLGYTILQAFSGEEALGICDTYEGIINLLLTDVIMPGMNGKQLAEKFLQKRPDTAIVFMSGYTDDVIGVHGVLDPGTIFIQKPITPNSLLLKVRNVLDKREEKLADLALSENFGALHILLVDDDEANRNLVQMFLKNYSFKIDVAESGVKALEKFKSIRYDLVLMDMVMPEMDGYAAVAEIRKWEKQQNMLPTPIIAVTGNDTWEGLEKCLDAGCTSHLAKPIRKENLKKVIAAYAGRNRQSMPDHGTTQRGKMAVVVDIDLKDLVPAYLQSRLRDVETLREALSREEYETIRILGHSMKGSGAIYGFDAITEIGMQIEQSAKENNRTDIDQLLHKLSDYLEHVEVVYG